MIGATSLPGLATGLFKPPGQIIFLCYSAGTCALIERFFATLKDPFFLRIDASTPVETLRKMRGDEYDSLV
jgi:hypothetical protein